MGVRSARISDLLAIRALAADSSAQVLGPPLPGSPSPVGLILRGWYGGMIHRGHTMVVGRAGPGRGFVQAQARPGRESWDVVRLACLAPDPECAERVCSELLGRICAVAAQSGALRTFARAPAEDGDRLALLIRHSFRPYATEITHHGVLWPLVQAATEPGPDVRMRLPRDGWDVFSLYCALTPAMVRHAESRSLREWTPPGQSRLSMQRPQWPVREVALGDQGSLLAWLRWQPARAGRPQRLDLLVRPEALDRLPELVRFAAYEQGLDVNSPTLCRTREYDGRLSSTLNQAGFEPVLRETLLVRHTVARVSERQLLIAALRAQGLGIEISRYRRGAEAGHQRLASSRETEHHYYDRSDRHEHSNRTCDHR